MTRESLVKTEQSVTVLHSVVRPCLLGSLPGLESAVVGGSLQAVAFEVLIDSGTCEN